MGLCLDTAHLWGAGVAIGTAEEVDALVESIAARIGLQRLAMVHFNDSKAAFALPGRSAPAPRRRGDRERRPGPRSLTHPALAHVAYYLETPGMDEGYDAVNMERARDLAAGVRPAPLPPEALELRGSRARAAEPA